jgi:predicted secreted protein
MSKCSYGKKLRTTKVLRAGDMSLPIDETAAGSTVRLAAGEHAQVTLPETRSGGYKWQVVSPESPVFSVNDDGFEMAAGVGGAGIHRWTLTASHPGEAKLELAHGRSWEPGAGKRFEVTVVVK